MEVCQPLELNQQVFIYKPSLRLSPKQIWIRYTKWTSGRTKQNTQFLHRPLVLPITNLLTEMYECRELITIQHCLLIYCRVYTACFWNNTFSKCELIARFSSSPANCRCHPELHEYAWCNIIVFDMNDGFVQQLNMKCNMHRVLQKYNSVVTQIEGARVYKRTQLNDNNELINCLTAHKGLI